MFPSVCSAFRRSPAPIFSSHSLKDTPSIISIPLSYEFVCRLHLLTQAKLALQRKCLFSEEIYNARLNEISITPHPAHFARNLLNDRRINSIQTRKPTSACFKIDKMTACITVISCQPHMKILLLNLVIVHKDFQFLFFSQITDPICYSKKNPRHLLVTRVSIP